MDDCCGVCCICISGVALVSTAFRYVPFQTMSRASAAAAKPTRRLRLGEASPTPHSRRRRAIHPLRHCCAHFTASPPVLAPHPRRDARFVTTPRRPSSSTWWLCCEFFAVSGTFLLTSSRTLVAPPSYTALPILYSHFALHSPMSTHLFLSFLRNQRCSSHAPSLPSPMLATPSHASRLSSARRSARGAICGRSGAGGGVWAKGQG
ncbi:hypothetical protein B0H13DRAFT_2377138 [Mycena leptocephala]|nr:hypothetical protein B0H13DRAFT_2377138 [Mycena leptocephala]